MDLYKEEINRLKQSEIYLQLLANCEAGNDNGCTALVNIVNEAVHYCYQRSKLIVRHMGEFTLHDGEHLFRVLRWMGLLIPESTLKQLSNPELALLILCAFFHDMGMAPAEAEVNCWLGIWQNGQSPTESELIEHNKYAHFKAGKQIQIAEIRDLRAQAKYPQAEVVERYIISDYLRVNHADRVISVLQNDWADKIKYKDVDLAYPLATLCRSHNEDILKVRELDSSLVVGDRTFICLPFISVLLRLADILDFDGNRTPKVLFAHLGIKDPVSLKEWEKHRAIDAWTMPPTPGGKITFSATCNHPAIEAAIRRFCDYIDYELSGCTNVLTNLHDPIRKSLPEYYHLSLPNSVERSKIKAKTDLYGVPLYIYSDTKFTLNKEQIIDILMGTKLYGQPSAALRELVQNSIDTCKLRQKMEISWGRAGYKPIISIRFIKEGSYTYLEVEDNGVGMDQEIIDRYYSKVGTSYYKSGEFSSLNTSLKSSFIPTSRFGIGILSCFMVTDSIEVQTQRILKAHESAPALSLSVAGQESIFYTKLGNRTSPGTTTRLRLRDNNPWAHMDSTNLFTSVRDTIPFPPFDICIQIYDQEFTHSLRRSSDIEFDSRTDKLWLSNNEKLREFRINFNGQDGIEGACIASIFEQNGEPQSKITAEPKVVLIDNQPITLESTWFILPNRFYKTSQNVDWDTNAQKVSVSNTNSAVRESKSRIALHGVAIPTSVFAEWSGNSYLNAMVSWPIFVMLDINVGEGIDINLNSARTEILKDDQWFIFEKRLLNLILQTIKQEVSPEYWQKFKNIISSYNQYPFAEFMDVANSL
jgi:molecular chaperone HtpG